MFCVTRDHLDKRKLNVVGPSSCTLSAAQIMAHPQSKQFRMLDDDRTLVYTGYFVGEDEFEPLDCFGMGVAGCTIIQYKDSKGVWRDL
jgi:hypothetical protein